MLTRLIALGSVVLILTLSGASLVTAQDQTGLILNTGAAYEGYTLFSPLTSTMTYLIDNDGRLVHVWQSEYTPGNAVYLLENGHLLRTANTPSQVFDAGGKGGRVEEFNWEGELVWAFDYASDRVHLHHDVEQLPDGNILMIAWEYKAGDEAIAAGRDPDLLPGHRAPGSGSKNRPQGGPPPAANTPSSDRALWADHVIEVDPSTNTIVWEWYVWDHLVQDYDPAQSNYGVVADHPELIDLNYVSGPVASDWNHINAVDYNPDLDQIMLSVHNFSEIWIIDHSTTTEEAAGHTGGNSGKGGDLLYRWGNPQAYDAGTPGDQQFFVQHDAKWIELGLPGEGHILVFNNGDQRRRGYSSVDEIIPPVNADGTYSLIPNTAYGPAAPTWTYVADPAESFYATNISGAQRLPNGNTLICDGPSGTFFEVTLEVERVWQYINPIFGGPAQSRQQKNHVFRAERYAPDYPGLADKDLTPGDPLG